MITSTRNPSIRAAQALAKRRDRLARRQFLIEGRRELSRALAAGVEVVQLFTDPARLGPDEAELVDAAAAGGADVIDVSAEVLDRLGYRAGTEPLVAVAAMFDTSLAGLALPPAAPLLLVMAGVEKPGNIGAMLRTAAAAAVDAVVVADPVADVFNPNVVRASVGALFTVPVAVAGGAEAVGWLRSRGIAVLAATPDGGRPHWEVPLTGPAAVVVGAEHAGLSPEWLAAADDQLTIPMPPESASGADSMNVGTAAAVLLFEAVRQRAPAPRN
ncbi:MAG: TrmH family RNA methyltransferase [Acidimicrobiales bacterium]